MQSAGLISASNIFFGGGVGGYGIIFVQQEVCAHVTDWHVPWSNFSSPSTSPWALRHVVRYSHHNRVAGCTIACLHAEVPGFSFHHVTTILNLTKGFSCSSYNAPINAICPTTPPSGWVGDNAGIWVMVVSMTPPTGPTFQCNILSIPRVPLNTGAKVFHMFIHSNWDKLNTVGCQQL